MQKNDKTGTLFTYRELLLGLKKLCKEKRTGVMLIKNENGDIAQFSLEQGTIFDVVFKGKKGKAALSLIKDIQQGKATFSNRLTQEATIEKKLSLTTVQIFQILTVDINLSTAKTEDTLPLATSLSMTENLASPAHDSATQKGPMIVIEAQLATIIGPVAKIIFFDYAQKVIHAANDFKQLNSVVEKISKKVLAPEQQKLFRQNILAFISQHHLKNHDAILQALTHSDKKLPLNNTTLGLCITKQTAEGKLNTVLANKLLLQIKCAGNLGRYVSLLALLRLLESTDTTGLLEVREKSKIGCFYFDKGVLSNAVECGMSGKIIAMDILQWNHDYLVFKAMSEVMLEKISHQIQQSVDSLAKEITLLKISPPVYNTPLPRYSHADEASLMTTAIEFTKSCDGAQAEKIFTDILIRDDDNFNAWLWLSRVLTNMTAIEITLKKAENLHSKNTDLVEEVRKFTLAKKTLLADFVIRCPFCWMPTAENDNQCHYCQSNFFIQPYLFTTLGKAKSEILDQAIERYSQVLQKNNLKHNLLYVRFYLAMAYLNRKYFQESLDQFNEIARLAPKNKALITQGNMLTRYMNFKGLNIDKMMGKISAQQKENDKFLKEKILVVEDSLVTRKVITRTLVANGYEIFEAKNAFEALSEIEKKHPDMILLDIILPGKDGYEILDEIRKKPMFEKTPVIMLTARDGLLDKLKGKVSTANEYLTKPFQPEELLAVVRKYLLTTPKYLLTDYEDIF